MRFDRKLLAPFRTDFNEVYFDRRWRREKSCK